MADMSCERIAGVAPRVNFNHIAGLVLALTVGCARVDDPITIIPAQMKPSESSANHPQGDGYVLSQSSSLSTRIRFQSVRRWGLVVTTRAEPAGDGGWPRLRVEVDREPAHVLVIADRRPLPYWINFTSEPGFADLKVSLVRDGSGAEPLLILEGIEIVPLEGSG